MAMTSPPSLVVMRAPPPMRPQSGLHRPELHPYSLHAPHARPSLLLITDQATVDLRCWPPSQPLAVPFSLSSTVHPSLCLYIYHALTWVLDTATLPGHRRSAAIIAKGHYKPSGTATINGEASSSCWRCLNSSIKCIPCQQVRGRTGYSTRCIVGWVRCSAKQAFSVRTQLREQPGQRKRGLEITSARSLVGRQISPTN